MIILKKVLMPEVRMIEETIIRTIWIIDLNIPNIVPGQK
jgi:hypothetical protein